MSIAMRLATLLPIVLLCGSTAGAQELHRASVWDLKLGQASRRSRPRASSAASPAARMADRRASASRAGAISSAAGADADGLHEVYFEYDDELRIHRPRQRPRPRGDALGRHHRS